MVGRNDPCPCGSGKKFKKCHGRNTIGEITTRVSEEIDRIVEEFITESFQNADYMKLEERNHQWQNELQHAFANNLIDTIAMETYIYIDHPALWRDYLNKQLAEHNYQQVKEVLASWLYPTYLLTKVEKEDRDLIMLTDELTNANYMINNSTVTASSGDWLFGIFMPDSRKGENGLTATGSVITISKERGDIVEALRAKLQNNVIDSLELYKTAIKKPSTDNATPKNVVATVVPKKEAAKEVVEVFKKETVAPSTSTDAECSPFTTDILTLVKQYLTEYNLVAENFVVKLQNFLEQTEMKAKKAATVAAGAILAGQANSNIADGGLVKVKDVASYFEVSASSISKYRDQISEFLAK